MGLTDNIAAFLMELLDESTGELEVQRQELAQRFGVVPSQINYVLASRFRPEQGYRIESRRGGGGYIRIYRVQDNNAGRIMHLVNAIGESLDAETASQHLNNLLAYDILKKYDMPLCDRVLITSAIANHDEGTGGAKDPVSAALILADKSDVRRNRVRNTDRDTFDIHDRVNYAVTGTTLKVDPEDKKISLNLQVDESICTMYEYFDIFLGRMMMCRGAAEMLGCQFRLSVNGSKVL